MQLRHLPLAASLVLILSYSGIAYAANPVPRTCSSAHASVFEQNSTPSGGTGGTGHEPTIPPGGIGGTGHEPTIPPGGIGGTELKASIENSGIGGTGHEPTTPPGGIGGTGIMAAGTLVNVNGVVTVEDYSKQKIQLASGDEICLGDRIASSGDAKAKILFADGAILYLLKNTEISLTEYYYSAKEPKLNRSLVTLSKGDIRSVSGKISKLNPQKYSFQTPASTIRVIGTDFLVTHLQQQEGALEAGTYTKVISGEVSVQSSTSTIKLRAGESSHVMLNGTQSIISGGGGTCTAP